MVPNAEVQEQQPQMGVLLRASGEEWRRWRPSKLKRIRLGREFGDDVLFYQPLKALQNDGSLCDRPVVAERRDLRFFGTGMTVAVLKHERTVL